jgi:hypothetical protein
MPEDQPEPFFIPHKIGQRLLGVRSSYYWGLVRKKKIVSVRKGKASRASFPSIKAYAEELLAEAEIQESDVTDVRKSKVAAPAG